MGVTQTPTETVDSQIDLFNSRLRDVIGVAKWETWIRPLSASFEDSGLQLVAPNRFNATWVRDNYTHQVREIAGSVWPEPFDVMISDINVNINITHKRVQDLDVFLVRQSDNKTVELFTDVGGGGDDFGNDSDDDTTLDDDAGGRFAVDGSTGVVTVANGTLLNREAAASHNITVRAASSDGSSNTQVMTINVNDVDEFDVGTITDSDVATNAAPSLATLSP